jgi:hypothetical protein
MNKCSKFINTFGSIRQNISENEIHDKLGTSISTDILKHHYLS